MEISEITELIISYAPAISSVIGIIISLIVGIKRIKQANRDTLEECRKQNAAVVENVAQIARNNEELRRENDELKQNLTKVMAKLQRVKIKEE
jgi:FtsZ-binding cell division protein ZapB